jgi:uncharacterized protein (DUF1800 family)
MGCWRYWCHRGLRVVLPALLAACGQHGGSSAPPAVTLASTSQGAPAVGQVTRFAAARFADQVSFGATPELVAAIEQQGFEPWIDAQFALPVVHLNAEPNRRYGISEAENRRAIIYSDSQIVGAMLHYPDQLRQRVSWALAQYIPVNADRVLQFGTMVYANFLQDHAFGNYATLLRDLGTNPPMGVFLDNLSNRPKSDECPWCAPNENYSRELLQLFTLGVVKLNPDGSTQRDAAGRPLETYDQADVEALTRAMTGWQVAVQSPQYDYSSLEGVLVPDSWNGAHDRGEKRLLGATLPAGNDAPAELDAVVQVLMQHQNIAPFVALRLIQHLVTSNPTPAYVARVGAVFRNNGSGVAGDMKAVVKAILLDTEARRGDVQGADTLTFGKMREPILWYTGLLRGLGCSMPIKTAPDPATGTSMYALPDIQHPYAPPSVFSFYLPTDRAPGSNLLAPEQRLLTSGELALRLAGYYASRRESAFADAGCKLDAFGQALSDSPRNFIDLVSARYFGGAIPYTLRQNLIDMAAVLPPDGTPSGNALLLLSFALSTPYYAAMQ